MVDRVQFWLCEPSVFCLARKNEQMDHERPITCRQIILEGDKKYIVYLYCLFIYLYIYMFIYNATEDVIK